MAKDTSSLSFWDQISDSRLFCQQECAERCHADNEDNETYDDLYPVRMNYDDEVPIVSLPHQYSDQTDFLLGRRRKERNLLPWADLHGNQKDSLLTQRELTDGFGNVLEEGAGPITREARLRKIRGGSSPTRSLLPFSNGVLGSTFNDLPQPRFLSGIPTKAYAYQPDGEDPIDVNLHKALKELSQEAALTLALRRVHPGRYEIDGRNVNVYWEESSGSHRLLVHEDEVDGPSIADMPLRQYISLVANVAMDLRAPGCAGALTFAQSGAPKTSDSARLGGEDRYRAMRIACTQAKLREQEAGRQSSGPARGSFGGIRR
jgi:hypothetical protein